MNVFNLRIGILATVMVMAFSLSATSIPESFASPVVLMDGGVGADLECDEKCYRPFVSYVATGEEIIFVNMDSMPHTVTSGVPRDNQAGTIFDSGMMSFSDSWNFSIDEAGEYQYFCMVHPWMLGTVNVMDFDTSDLKNKSIQAIS